MAEFRIKLKIPEHSGLPVLSASIYVSSSMSIIEDLQKHILKLFQIDYSFYLVRKGNLLHPKENVKVLQHGDVVTIKKGSFVPTEYSPKREKSVGKLKKAFHSFGDRVAAFFAMFEPNVPCEDKEESESSDNLTLSVESDKIFLQPLKAKSSTQGHDRARIEPTNVFIPTLDELAQRLDKQDNGIKLEDLGEESDDSSFLVYDMM